ncbi:hypothetical protein [Streptococcus pseudoporcinus]|uniref:Uncharacterized protein n=1 Tax=Streptococcus pseudoporcinus TaxID=361101 RepID=A0A4U9XI36_9STRE|nr:hypothetical protein [Streptococcus pseudoporcinus]VTS12626.1 Uncharacterised protein [Streptococcus pseudoporcinus]VUC65253.1 Uncharacterised protein [Streptococcus pseudoporcinus]VUC96063.1 Uncharacterised protein [Streptococcus pseudoporcinus]VUC96459.1 Uncharacterised protein [Streptococcus pseudoporcinus]
MSEQELEELAERFLQLGYLVGKVSQRDMMFKYTVPIDVERTLSFSVTHPQTENKRIGVVNPSGVAYTYEFRDGIEDKISEVLYDGSINGLFHSLVKALSD